MDFNTSQTKINLARAFAGECQGGARYQFIAQKAMQEGKINIQTIFRTLAKNEMAHARIFWDELANHSGNLNKNIEIKAGYPFENGELVDMIKYASSNEKSESTTIYPSFSKIAEDEGFKDIAQKFKLVALVENDHFMLLDELYNRIKSKQLYTMQKDYEWKCSHCGHVHIAKDAFKVCPLCALSQDNIELDMIPSKK